MRLLYAFVGTVAVAIGLVGWHSLGSAQPPARPKPRPASTDDFGGDRPAPALSRVPASPREKPATGAEPSIELDWHGPTAVTAGAKAEYTVIARNSSPIPLYKVVVQVRVPDGAKAEGTEPKAVVRENVLLWDLGTLKADDERPLKITFIAPPNGEMTCQAWVTFTGSSALRVKVREPKVGVKIQPPEKLRVGDSGNVVIAVSNPGDVEAEKVKLGVAFTDGLDVAKGTKTLYDLGTLAVGETRQVTIACTARRPGEHRCQVLVEGTGTLKATDLVIVRAADARLTLDLAGPKLRYIDRKGTYAIQVANAGDATASSAIVTHTIPAGFKFVSATREGQYDPTTRSVKWAIGELAPGQSREVKCDLVATADGEFTHKAAVAAGHVRAAMELATKVEGLVALSMDVVDSDDPIEAGADTTYEVRINNKGSKDEPDVKLIASVPAQMRFKSATGPTRYTRIGNDVVFEPMAKLPARGEAVFKITVTATQKGDARFKATLTTAGTTDPIVKQESTRVYSD